MGQQIKAFFFGLIPVIFAFGISLMLYYNVPSTPVFILIFILIFLGIVLGIGIYRKFQQEISDEQIFATKALPELESDIIYVSSSDFNNKFEGKEGKLFLHHPTLSKIEAKSISSLYKKITDTLIIKFTKGVELEINGVAAIGVGDEQFCIFGFDNLILNHQQTQTKYSWKGEKLIIEEKNKPVVSVLMQDGAPSFVYQW